MSILIRGFIFRIIFTGIGFFASLLIAKLAGASEFGVLSLIIVNAALIHIITGLGTDAAIVWHGATAKEFTRNKMFTFTIGTAVIQLILFYIPAIGIFLITHKTLLGGESSQVIFFSELIYFTGLVLIDKFSSLFYSQHDARQCNKILAIVSMVMLCGILILWMTRTELIADFPILLYSLFIFIPSVAVSVVFMQQYKPGFEKITKPELRSFLSFSILVFVTNIIQFVAYRADYWFINWYYDFTELGVYAQASKFAQLLWIVPGILAGLIIPALKNEKQTLTNTAFLSICRLSFFFHLMISILLLAVAYGIYRLFLPETYSDGFLALLIMLPGYLFFIYAIILASFFSAKRLLVVNFYGSLLCFALMIVFDFILIPAYGYYGAAFANLIAYTVVALYFILKSRKIVNADFSDYFMVRKSDIQLLSLSKPETNHKA